MATKPSWLTANPAAGEGNIEATINLSNNHTGRLRRTGNFTITNKNGTKPAKTISVSQAGRPLFMTVAKTEYTFPATGGTVTITGTANGEGFWNNTVRLPITANHSIKVNGTAVTMENYLFPDDPGANAQYSFEIVLHVAANTSAKPLAINMVLYNGNKMHYDAMTLANGVMKDIKITVAAAASTLSTNVDEMSFDNPGTAKKIQINSNDEWEIS